MSTLGNFSAPHGFTTNEVLSNTFGIYGDDVYRAKDNEAHSIYMAWSSPYSTFQIRWKIRYRYATGWGAWSDWKVPTGYKNGSKVTLTTSNWDKWNCANAGLEETYNSRSSYVFGWENGIPRTDRTPVAFHPFYGTSPYDKAEVYYQVRAYDEGSVTHGHTGDATIKMYGHPTFSISMVQLDTSGDIKVTYTTNWWHNSGHLRYRYSGASRIWNSNNDVNGCNATMVKYLSKDCLPYNVDVGDTLKFERIELVTSDDVTSSQLYNESHTVESIYGNKYVPAVQMSISASSTLAKQYKVVVSAASGDPGYTWTSISIRARWNIRSSADDLSDDLQQHEVAYDSCEIDLASKTGTFYFRSLPMDVKISFNAYAENVATDDSPSYGSAYQTFTIPSDRLYKVVTAYKTAIMFLQVNDPIMPSSTFSPNSEVVTVAGASREKSRHAYGGKESVSISGAILDDEARGCYRVSDWRELRDYAYGDAYIIGPHGFYRHGALTKIDIQRGGIGWYSISVGMEVTVE